jgi:hypothetical protein
MLSIPDRTDPSRPEPTRADPRVQEHSARVPALGEALSLRTFSLPVRPDPPYDLTHRTT